MANDEPSAALTRVVVPLTPSEAKAKAEGQRRNGDGQQRSDGTAHAPVLRPTATLRPAGSSSAGLVDEWDEMLGTTPHGGEKLARRASEDDCMVCRICEARVSLQIAEQHTRCCVMLSRCEQDAVACEAQLRKLSSVLVDKIEERRKLRNANAAPPTMAERAWRC